jgi:hypothetical protein
MVYLKKTLRGIELIQYFEKNTQSGNYTNPERERSYEFESAQRAKREIIDIALSNNWDYMLTQTISPKYHDRYNTEQQKNLLIKTLKNFRERYDPQLAFILIPETHKDGAIHFHGLLKFNIPEQHLDYVKERNGTQIFKHKLLDKRGFNELAKIYNHQEFVTYYITKYITKSVKSKITDKRYYRSQNLDKPQKLYLDRRLDKWEDVQAVMSLYPSYEGQFATKWRLTTAEFYGIFRYNQRVKDFLKNE